MTEKQIMKRFCEEQLDIDIETLNASQLREVKKSLSYGMYAIPIIFEPVKKEFWKAVTPFCTWLLNLIGKIFK